MSGADQSNEAMPMPLRRQRTIHPDWYYDHANLNEHQRSNSWRYNIYTVAWVCALSIEMAAAQMMLDEEHEELPRLGNDTNKYLLGRIKQHNVVIACLPHGSYGTINASRVSTHLVRSFTCVRTVLMVGIGGGAPNRADLRLGDVVVGQRVMQHDLGKKNPDGQMQHTAVAKVVSHALSTVVSALRGRHVESEHVLCVPQTTLQDNPRFSRPTAPDLLFQAGYNHVHPDSDCSVCDQSKLMLRRKRSSDDPMIHYGAIASGNLVIKDAVTRDKKANELDVICFEMESAGLMDSLDCLPIRGICDYSDSHKNNKWQEYAALTAATYAKEFLHELPLTATTHPNLLYELGRSNTAGNIGIQSPVPAYEPVKDSRQQFIDSLAFPNIESRRIAIKARRYHKTCQWLLDQSEYKAWTDSSQRNQHHGFLWIRGKPGAGKSTLMEFIYHNMHSWTWKNKNRKSAVASFFFHARGEYLEKSVLGMYRSLLFQLFKAFPDLKSVIDDSAISSHAYNCDSVLFLKDLFCRAIGQLNQRSFTCLIDALDECDEQQVMDMVNCFEETAELSAEQGICLRICFSSRHYPYIEMRFGLRLVLEHQPGHTEDLSTYVRHKLHLYSKNPALSADLEPMILGKAAGVFLWVVLVVDILNKEYGRGGLSLKTKLEKTPSDLSKLFKDILTRDNENTYEMLLCVLWILYAKRPLQPAEYRHALWAGLRVKNLVDPEMPDMTALDANDMSQKCVTSSSKGLAEITKSDKPTVQFIHESVRDFLVKDGGLAELWPKLGYDWSIEGHDRLKECCDMYINTFTSNGAAETLLSTSSPTLYKNEEQPPQSISRTYTFLEYACQNVLYHADSAANAIPQDVFLAEFRLSDWISLYNSFKRLQTRRYLANTDILYILAEKGYPELIRTMLKKDKNINVCGGQYRYPLFAALAYRNMGSIVALLDLTPHAFNMDRIAKWSQIFAEKSIKQKTPLTWAASEGEGNIIRQLLKDSAKIDDKDQNGDTALLAALKNSQRSAMILLIEKGAEINAKDRNSDTALLVAVKNDQESTATLLIEKGAEINIKDRHSNTALLAAIKNNQENMVRLLIEKGAEINANDQCGNTALLATIENKQENIAMMLIEKGAEVDAKGRKGETALLKAVKNDQESIAILLIEKGAETNANNQKGETALLTVLQNGYDDIALLLLENGADWECTELSYFDLLRLALKNSCHKFLTALKATENDINAVLHGETLRLAAEGGDLSRVKTLLEAVALRSADDTERWKSLMTPAIIAASSKGYAPIVEALIHVGADAHCYTSDYETLFFVAARNGHREVAELLIQQGADVNYVAPGSAPVIVLAAGSGHEEVVQLLIQQSVDVDDFAPKSSPAINFAAREGHEGVVQLLIREGADFNKEGSFGTPLMSAADNRHWGVVKILKEAGAVIAADSVDIYHVVSRANSLKAPPGVIELLIEATPDFDVQYALRDGGVWERQSVTETIGILDVLIRAGANVNTISPYGSTALHRAASLSRESAVQALIERGADINAQDIYGSTPLHIAITHGRNDSATNILIQNGADVNIINSKGKSALDLATGSRRGDICERLIAAGATIK